MRNKRVIIIGGGFAGLNAAKVLGRSGCDVWLIDKSNHHLFQPLLYQVATAALSPADIAMPIREILRRYKNITVIMGHVVGIDKEEKIVHMANGETFGFDSLVAAVGARHSYFGHGEWERHAPGIKTIKDALAIRERILVEFERAERCDSIREAAKHLNFVIIGGGPTGVEIAGAIAEIAYKTMLRNFRRIDTNKTRIYLIEGAPYILGAYPEKLAAKAKKLLEKMGVNVMTNTMVTAVTGEGVTIGDEFIEAKNVIWAAGNQASPLLKTLDVPLDNQGRVLVEPDLSIKGFPDIFVLGDAAHAKDENGNPLPGLAPVAVQQGRYVARNIKKELPKDLGKPFKYFDKGTMATIGKAKAVGMMGNFQFSGLFAWLAWGLIHIAYLIGFKSRAVVLTQWFFSYIFDQRGARLVTRSIEEDS
ncbi:MAG: NAD(P)/FAD-dependent oxidoreductase [bacterium]|nr:NAD(P)/FAD-dependent oxidoreductase [bacterium]